MMFASACEPGSAIGAVIAGVIFRQLFDVEGSTIALPSPVVHQPAPLAAPQPYASFAGAGRQSGQGSVRQPAVHPSGATRRRDIMQCRSLRTIIQTYETNFEKAYGRKPRTGDRGNLIDTYTQYRALKQRIRGELSAASPQLWLGIAPPTLAQFQPGSPVASLQHTAARTHPHCR